MDKFAKAVARFGDWLGVLAGILLVALMALTTGNIILRQVASPFGGAPEVVGFLSAMCAGLSLMYSQKKKAHIAIDIITGHMPKRPRAFLFAAMNLIAVAVFAMATWQIGARAMALAENGTLSSTLRWAYYPFIWVVCVCFGLFTFNILVDAIMKIREAVKAWAM